MKLKDFLKYVNGNETLNIIERSFSDGCIFDNKNEKIPDCWLNARVNEIYIEDGMLTIEITEA